MNAEILIIDDDEELGDMLTEFLETDQFRVRTRLSGEGGLETLAGHDFDLVILDIMLPAMSGIDALRAIREGSDIPVIMLTARGDDVDRILGLEFGADDYLTKPFNPRELLARIRAILRRSQAAETHEAKLTVGSIELEKRTRQVTANGQALRLTGTEFELLTCLLRQPGEVVSREQLCEAALGRRLLPYDRSIDTHISNLRRKLDKAGVRSPAIENQRGVGYRCIETVAD